MGLDNMKLYEIRWIYVKSGVENWNDEKLHELLCDNWKVYKTIVDNIMSCCEIFYFVERYDKPDHFGHA